MDVDFPCQQHLGTNYVPSIDEINVLKNFIRDSANELHTIDAEIEQLQQRVKLLQEMRSEVSDRIGQYEALISPARRLGPDILEEIFMACLATSHNPCMSVKVAPLLLTRICSSWRTIAHSIPRLWSSIHVVLPSLRLARDPPEHTVSFIEGLGRKKLLQRQVAAKQWLRMSGACPLSISVYQHSGYNIASTDAHILEKEKQLQRSFIQDVLVPHSQRWYDVDICLSRSVLEVILAVRDVPILKKLHITDQKIPMSVSERNGNGGPSWNNLISLLQASKNITSLAFHGFVIRSTDLPMIPQMVSGQLTELNLDAYPNLSSMLSAFHGSTITANFVSSVIRNCRNLTSLKLVLVTGGLAGRGGDDGPISFPNLKTLALSASVSAETLHFVESLRIPDLKQLDLHFYLGHYDGRDDLGHRIFGALLRECGHSLKFFGLNASGPITSLGLSLVQVLPLIPMVKEIKFYSTHHLFNRWRRPSPNPSDCGETINDHFIDSLSPQGKEYPDILCPRLEILECDPEVITDVSPSSLREFIKARKSAHLRDNRVAPIKRVRIFVNQYKQMEDNAEDLVELPGSTFYFRKLNYSFSPWEGLESCFAQKEGPMMFVPYEISSHT